MSININLVIIRYVSTKVKSTFYKLHSLDMNLYVQQRSILFTFSIKFFLSININLVIIRYASTKVKNMLYILYLSEEYEAKKEQSRHKFVCTTKIIEYEKSSY